MASDYFLGLDINSKKRYLDKINVINGRDPYTIMKSEFGNDFPSITFIDMVNYLVYGVSAYTTADFKAFKSLESYNQFRCGWVKEAFALKTNGMYLVMGKVKHSQRLSEKPLNPWFITTEEGTVDSAHCTCMAGLGEACSHVAALMFFVQDAVLHTDAVSVTSVAPYWGQPSKKNVEFAEVKDIDFSTSKMCEAEILSPQILSQSVPQMNEEEFENLCKRLHNVGSKSALLNVVAPYNNVPKNKLYLRQIYEEKYLSKSLEELQEISKTILVPISKSDAQKIFRETLSQENSKKWFNYRSGRITASNMKAVCSTKLDSPSITTLKRVCYPMKVIFTSKATEWGCKHEGIAREQYFETQKHSHENFVCEKSGLIVNPDFPHFGASPDGLVSCSCCGLGCFEVKCPYCMRDKELDDVLMHNCIETTNGISALSKKHMYYFQVQTQIFISSRKYCDFVLWLQKGLYIERIFPDNSFWNEISMKADKFQKMIVMPELLGKVFTKPDFPNGKSRKVFQSVKKNPNIIFL